MTSLRIVSDGTPRGTRVLDEHGKEISKVTEVAWSVKATASKATVKLTLLDVPVDVVGELDRGDTLSADPGATGNSIASGDANQVVEENVEKKSSTVAARSADVWQHYVRVTGSRRIFDDKRKRIIRNALALQARIARDAGEADPDQWAVDRCKLAITGLAVSPWHQGENPQGKKYLEVRYALKGLGDESDDERIDKMCDLAVIRDPQRAGVDPDKVERYLDYVRYTLQHPESEIERARRALAALREMGFTIKRVSTRPWAVIA